jgi:hypothetical protein
MTIPPNPASEITVTKDMLSNYIAVHTSTNSDDVYYYTSVNQVDTYYAYIDEHFAYPVNSKPISITSEKLNTDYHTDVTLGGDPCIKRNKVDWFVSTSDTTLLQFSNIPGNTQATNPLQLSYSCKNKSKNVTGTLTLPMSSYDSSGLSVMLSSVLSKELVSQGFPNVTPDSISFQYNAGVTDPAANVKPISNISKYTCYLSCPSGNDFQLQLQLDSTHNSVLGSSLGFSNNITMDVLYPPSVSSQYDLLVDPYQLVYSYVDYTYNFTRSVSLSYPGIKVTTNKDLCKLASQIMINDIISYCGYVNSIKVPNVISLDASTNAIYNNYLSIDVDLSGTYTFAIGPLMKKCTITLEVKKTQSISKTNLSFIDIPITSLGLTFGLDKNISISGDYLPASFTNSKKLISKGLSSGFLPTSLTYTWKDNLSYVSGTGTIDFPNFNTMTQSQLITKLQNGLLLTNYPYPYTPSSFIISYDPASKKYSFGTKSLPITITLQFSKNSLLGLAFGCMSDVTFSNITSPVSNTNVVTSYRLYNNLPLFFDKGVWNVLYTDTTTSTPALYPIINGASTCGTISCNEWSQTDPSISLFNYGYTPTSTSSYKDSNNIQQTLTYYSHQDAYLYDQQTNLMFLMNALIPAIFYGSPSSNEFVPLSTCALDSQGNCVAPTFDFGLFGSQPYIIIKRDIVTLLPFSRDTISEPICPCVIKKSIVPTCQEICSTGKDPDGHSLLCNNPNDDPLVTPCQCYYEGPVNVIIKPMREYNPFKIVQKYVGEGMSYLGKKIAEGIKSFMLPLWNAVKIVVSYLSSIMAMVIETLDRKSVV